MRRQSERENVEINVFLHSVLQECFLNNTVIETLRVIIEIKMLWNIPIGDRKSPSMGIRGCFASSSTMTEAFSKMLQTIISYRTKKKDLRE